MTKLKWEEGKMYQFRIDMVDKYLSLFEICKDIFNLIGYKTFIVKDIDREGRVTKLVGISNDILDIDYWFYADEIKYFDLVEDSDVEYSKEEQEMTLPTKTEQEIVVEWLEKLHYVMRNDSSVSEDLGLSGNELVLSTDLCYIYGATDIYDFIQMRYNQMIIAEVGRRKKELLDKRVALELELAEIKKELGE